MVQLGFKAIYQKYSQDVFQQMIMYSMKDRDLGIVSKYAVKCEEDSEKKQHIFFYAFKRLQHAIYVYFKGRISS